MTATVCTSTGATKTISAKYLAGCDGGRSTVRKLLNLSYDGFTLPQWLVACNVRYPFMDHGFTRAQFIVHPEHFCLIGKIDPSGLWRCSYNEREDMTREEVLENVHRKFEAMFPRKPGEGKLRKEDYELEMVSPYRLHQRTAPSYRKGRSFLAGDAAHACSPFGGMSTSPLMPSSALNLHISHRDGSNNWNMRCFRLSRLPGGCASKRLPRFVARQICRYSKAEVR